MSDVSGGPGWWQAADGKWYRPESIRGTSTRGLPNLPKSNRSRGRTIVVSVMVLIVVVGIAVAIHSRSGGHTRRRTAPVSTTVSTRTTPTASTTTTVPIIAYRVKAGDTLIGIAARFHVPMSTIVTRNHITNPNRLSLGQTLQIPPIPPIKLTITPAKAQAGQEFQFTLTGAAPAETITFEIDSPARKFTGGPHVASADGAVSATYLTDLGAPSGVYKVTATGDKSTTVEARFVVEQAGP